tara:strand:- start:3719 stop:5110 length:1392 start_codon:yes stop_codon:yes gene_type:complete
MSHRSSQALVSVEALLPSLGALSVNRASTPKQAPIAAGEKKKQKKSNGDDEEETGPRLGVLSTDPGTGQPVQWVKGDDKLDQDAHKRLIYAQNKEWAAFYPPPPPQKRPEEYTYTDWTSFYPSGNLQIENPHWLRAAPDNPKWPASRNKHDSLSDARIAFGDMLPGYLQALPLPTEKNSVEERSKREADIANRNESLAQLKDIVEKDGNKTDSKELEQSRALMAQMFRQEGVFGQYKRKKIPFPPPPGWMVMYKHRSPSSMEAQLAKKKGTKNEGKPGAFSDPTYVGPQYASWSEQDPSTKLYTGHQQDSPVQAWLVYLMYQKSSKTFDPREQARRKDATDEAKQRASANAAKRKEQSAQQQAKLEKDRNERKRAAEEERDAALAEASEQSRRAAQNDLPQGGGGEANDDDDLLDLLEDSPANAPVPAPAEDDDDDDVPANADPAEDANDALMRMLENALNDD